MKEQKTYTVFSKRVALALRNFGFNWIRIEPSLRNPGLNVWVFEDSLGLRTTIDIINGKR